MPTFQTARQSALDSASQFDTFTSNLLAPDAAVNSAGRIMTIFRASADFLGLGLDPYAHIQERDGTVVASTFLVSNVTSLNSVKVCATQFNDGFVVLLFTTGGGLTYRRFTSSGTDRDGSDISITISDLALSGAKIDIGADDLGRFTVLYSRTGGSAGTYIQRFEDDGTVSLPETLVTTNSTITQKLAVHPASGRITVAELTGTTFSAHRLDEDGTLLSTVTVHSGMGGGGDLKEIIQRYGDDGFVVFWIDTINTVSGGRFRAFDEDGNSLYATQTLTTTDPTANLIVNYGIKPFTTTTNYRILVTNCGTDPERYHILDNALPPNQTTEAFSATSNAFGRTSGNGSFLIGLNKTEWHHVYSNFSGTQRIGYEVFQSQSCRMSLWRVQRSARVFRNAALDPSAAGSVEGFYDDRSKLAGSNLTTDSAYLAQRSVDPDAAEDWTGFLGAADEDTVFVGGPESSELAASMEMNTETFAAQISDREDDLGISAIEFLYGGGRTSGYGPEGTGANAPAIQLTNTNGTFTLERHTSGGNIVDYAFLIRLPLSPNSTQATKSFWYVAGINGAGTEAATYIMANFDQYDTGESNALLIKLVYPSNIRSASEYTPGSTGTIDVYAMGDVNADDYEG